LGVNPGRWLCYGKKAIFADNSWHQVAKPRPRGKNTFALAITLNILQYLLDNILINNGNRIALAGAERELERPSL
jgi:hypothetical protein